MGKYIVTLEDNNEYVIVKEIMVNGIKYIILSPNDDTGNVLFRKVEIKDNEEFLIKLSDENELKDVLREFIKQFS